MNKNNYIRVLQDWNFWGNNKVETGIKRQFYLKKLSQLSDLEEVIGVCGVRRCGKTTLLLQLIQDLHKTEKISLKNTLYVNFEDPRLGESLTALDLFDIIEAYQTRLDPKGKFYLFLDEIQVVKDWEKFVRTIYDQQKQVKIFVSGSSSSIFDSKLSSLLSGRIVNLQVFPLNFVEFLQFKHQDKKNKSLKDDLFEESLTEYLTYGGFPRVVLEQDKIAKRQILVSYYESILEQDVILKNNIKQATVLKQLAKYVLSNVGKQLSSYSLQKTLNISSQNIIRYLDYLEDAYLIFRIPKFSYSVKKQIYNPDKVFCVDSGLVNTAGFSFSENKGHLLENLVYLKLKQQNKDLYYWKNGTEIDFLIRKGTQVERLVNVTTTVDDDQVWEKEIKSLAIAQKEYPQAEMLLISLYNQSNRQGNGLTGLKEFLFEKFNS